MFLIFISAFPIVFGQKQDDSQLGENWLKEYGIYSEQILQFRYDRYSKEDLVNFRQKLDAMKDAKFDEWEGVYFHDLGELSFSRMHLKGDVGFLDFYIYTCQPELRRVNYGKVSFAADAVQLLPEFAEKVGRDRTIHQGQMGRSLLFGGRIVAFGFC